MNRPAAPSSPPPRSNAQEEEPARAGDPPKRPQGPPAAPPPAGSPQQPIKAPPKGPPPGPPPGAPPKAGAVAQNAAAPSSPPAKPAPPSGKPPPPASPPLSGKPPPPSTPPPQSPTGTAASSPAVSPAGKPKPPPPATPPPQGASPPGPRPAAPSSAPLSPQARPSPAAAPPQQQQQQQQQQRPAVPQTPPPPKAAAAAAAAAAAPQTPPAQSAVLPQQAAAVAVAAEAPSAVAAQQAAPAAASPARGPPPAAPAASTKPAAPAARPPPGVPADKPPPQTPPPAGRKVDESGKGVNSSAAAASPPQSRSPSPAPQQQQQQPAAAGRTLAEAQKQQQQQQQQQLVPLSEAADSEHDSDGDSDAAGTTTADNTTTAAAAATASGGNSSPQQQRSPQGRKPPSSPPPGTAVTRTQGSPGVPLGVRPQAPSTQPTAGAYGGQTYAFPAEQPAAATTGEGQLVVAADSTRSSSIAADKSAAASAAAAAAARRQSTAAAATAGKRQSLTGRTDGGGNTGGSGSSSSGSSSVLRAGRLTIKCIAAHGVRSKAGAALEASVRITLGAVKAALVRRSASQQCHSDSSNFANEGLRFDIADPAVLSTGDSPPTAANSTNDSAVAPVVALPLLIELLADGAWGGDELLGSITLDAARFMQEAEEGSSSGGIGCGRWHKEDLPLTTPEDTGIRMIVKLDFIFEPSLVGMAVITLHEARGLHSAEQGSAANGSVRGSSGAQLHPYVAVELGEKYKKRGAAARNGGSAPHFRGEQLLLWIDRANWINDLTFKCLSEELGSHTPLGTTTVSLLPYMRLAADEAEIQQLELFSEEEDATKSVKSNWGNLVVTVAFLPAGKLSIRCETGRGLTASAGVGAAAGARQDPFLVLKAEGQAATLSRRSRVDKDGGSEPNWSGEVLYMDIVDQYMLKIDCLHHDLLGKDELIGCADLSLLPVFKRGKTDTWLELRTAESSSSSSTVSRSAGEVRLVLEFEGPPGVAYPQQRPGVDTFDDSARVNLKAQVVPRAVQQSAFDSTLVPAAAAEPDGTSSSSSVIPHPVDAEFTEEEIESAFKFLDLDRNNYIGAAEIRHILICMGELITDEEIDTMIGLVDSDGDGQVSYEEFHALVLSPDPVLDWSLRGAGADKGTNKSNKDGQERQKELQERSAKRTLLEEFIRESEWGVPELEMVLERHRKHLSTTAGGTVAAGAHVVDFDRWLELTGVEATGQYRKLFKLYSIAPPGEPEAVDLRQFLLGACTCLDMDKSRKTQFVFDLYDDDRSGFLSTAELTQVLMASHMQSAKQVAKKVQTIMKQVDADGSGTLSYEEFVTMSLKFPNVVFNLRRPDEE